MLSRESVSELQLTHEEKHKHLPLKGSKHNSPLSSGLVMRAAKSPCSRNAESDPGTMVSLETSIFLDVAAHTMTKEGFWRMKTLLLESGTSAKDFARTRSFCRLQIASTVNNFLSEKMISSVSVHDRVRKCLQLVKKNFRSIQSLFFLEVSEMLTSLHFER